MHFGKQREESVVKSTKGNLLITLMPAKPDVVKTSIIVGVIEIIQRNVFSAFV